jgi:phage baseplate assembly protein W
MAQYVGFSTKDACKPRTTNAVGGIDGGVGGVGVGGVSGGGTPQSIVWGKKYRLTDAQLVMQDFLNALNITLGSKVGQPGYGTKVWSFIFEPNTSDVQFQLENEIFRVAGTDPRIILNSVKAFPKENGILLEVELAVNPFNQAQLVSIFFNRATTTATFT